ncbi:hypothetical protein [Pleionea sp. CnH1-48]|uniref:hypothetical protein n=1 Tax=Pleionea sp. CnH1-48 TaxID=2954494 RepID=UPI0020980F59|nr:hypothetical protein [Pleionea sp. CnH1-48]MCO7224154.1 hypothetical protein [Pleionea sp. CnH1-48]
MTQSFRLSCVAILCCLSGVVAAQSADDDWDDDWGDSEEQSPWTWSGFVEAAQGRWLDSQPTSGPMQEWRAYLDLGYEQEVFRFQIKTEALYDSFTDEKEGRLREAWLQTALGEQWELKVGRQVISWGTGDLLFLNDLFPKSWPSYLNGRDDVYLKQSVDGIRIHYYGEAVNLDAVWMPRFEPDEFLRGQRFPLYLPSSQSVGFIDPPLSAFLPPEHEDDGELALRVFANLGSLEWSLFAYNGFFKSPTGFDQQGRLIHYPMHSLGASVRDNLAGGLVSAEVVHYVSKEDKEGTDPLIPNSESRLLLSYEKQIANQTTLSSQLYFERTHQYDALLAHSLQPQQESDAWQRMVTVRLVHLALMQSLETNLMAFYSMADDDYHWRLKMTYRMNDQWQLSGGGYWFGGKQASTFFGQLDSSDHLWLRVRYRFD